MLVWGPGRRKSKKTFSGQPKLPLGRLLRLASPTSVNPAGKIRQDRREKPNMNFLTSVVLGFHTTKTVLKRENDGSQTNLGRQMFENGRGRRCFAGFGSIWLGLVSARLALQTRRRRFFHHYGWRVQPDDSSAHAAGTGKNTWRPSKTLFVVFDIGWDGHDGPHFGKNRAVRGETGRGHLGSTRRR